MNLIGCRTPGRRKPIPELRSKVRNPPDLLSPSLSVSIAWTHSPENAAGTEPFPSHEPRRLAASSRCRRRHRVRVLARYAPVPSLRPAMPCSAPTVSSSEPAMAPAHELPVPPSPHAPAVWPWSTMDRWTTPSPRSTDPFVDPPVPSRHVASRAGHLAPPWLFCKKALGLSRI